jgi:8-oxo-dGTP pyrophosphatase MutT (NUDIX family)
LALYLNEGQLNLLFTRRQASLQHHSGEISFPGGGREAQDADLVETALREAQEEVGLLPPSVRVLGELTPLYIPPSRNLVHPIVGWVRGRPKFVINPGEVDCVIEVPVRRLLQPETVHEFTWHREGETYAAPCYRHNGDCIWGATAMILSEFLVLLERIARASAASRALEGP